MSKGLGWAFPGRLNIICHKHSYRVKQSITNIQRLRNQWEKILINVICNSVWHRYLRNAVSTAYKSLKFRFDWKLISVLNNCNSDQLSWHCLSFLLLLLKSGGRDCTKAKFQMKVSNTVNYALWGLYKLFWNSRSKQTTTQQFWLPARDLNDTSLK